jgi:chaperonin GroES
MVKYTLEKISKEAYVMKLKPLCDRVVLRQLEAEETTKSGIVLPGGAKEKPQQAEVLAVGPGGMVDGKEVVMQVKPGDTVIYGKYSGTEVKLEEDEYIIVRQNDILAIVE